MTQRGPDLPWIAAAGLLVLIVCAMVVAKRLLSPPRRSWWLLAAVLVPLPAHAAPSCLKAMPPLPVTATAKGSTWASDAMPPMRFRSSGQVVVTFAKPVDVDRACAAWLPKLPCGFVYEACTFGTHITAPNPCDPAFRGESFARLACHELGHVNGWPATHGD